MDTFIVIDGLPVVPEESRQKLIKFLLRKLSAVGHTSEDAVFMPVNDKNMSEGYVLREGILGGLLWHGKNEKLMRGRIVLLSSSTRPPNKPSPPLSNFTVFPWTRSTPFP